MLIKNALSIDLEDWYHPEFIRKHISINRNAQIVKSTQIILELLDKYGIKATFFILGDIAKRHPELIRNIYDKDHEIASHGMNHTPLNYLSYNELNQHLYKFKKIVTDILDKEVKIYGFRAPTFSINNQTTYALKCLVKNAYLYDSSVVPTNFFYYGLNNAPRGIYKPNLNNLTLKDSKSKLIEFPITVIGFGKLRIPISGGFFLRIFPYFIYKTLLLRINRKKRPFIIYFHPWEIYSKTFRINKIGILKYFITYYGIKSALKKVEKLLRDFKFGTVKEVIFENKVNQYK